MRIPVVDLISMKEQTDPSLCDRWEKDKENLIAQAKITYKDDFTKLLRLVPPSNSICGCLGPRDSDLYCPCNKSQLMYTFRYHLYEACTKLDYPIGSIHSFKFGTTVKQCFILEFNEFSDKYVIGFAKEDLTLVKETISKDILDMSRVEE